MKCPHCGEWTGLDRTLIRIRLDIIGIAESIPLCPSTCTALLVRSRLIHLEEEIASLTKRRKKR